jgi:hypothetical protein
MYNRFLLAYKRNIKQSYYRPGEAFRVPGGWGSHILRESSHEGGKVVSPTHRPPLLPQKKFLILFSIRGWVDPRAIVQMEELCQWKIPITTSGIEPATFWLVAQCHIAYIFPNLSLIACHLIFCSWYIYIKQSNKQWKFKLQQRQRISRVAEKQSASE